MLPYPVWDTDAVLAIQLFLILRVKCNLADVKLLKMI